MPTKKEAKDSGFVSGIFSEPPEAYFEKEGLSNTFLCRFSISPAHAFMPFTATPAMEKGTMVHLYILEPEKFWERYIKVPSHIPEDRRKKEYKDFMASHVDEDHVPIFAREIKELEAMKQSVEGTVAEALTVTANEWFDAEPEQTLMFEWLGHQCKGRVDKLFRSGDRVVPFDLKTTSDCRDFGRSVQKYNYYRQAAFYQNGLSLITEVPIENIPFVFVTVETKPPFGSMVHILDDDYIFHGLKEHAATVHKYNAWQVAGSNRDEVYPGVIDYIEKPKWL